MWSDQAFYFSDSSFQLELNLQFVRRTLIQTLEDFEAADCNRCCHIKCRCEQTERTPPGSVEPTPGQPLTGGIPSVFLTEPTPSQSLTGGIPPGALKEPTPSQSLTGVVSAVSLTEPTTDHSLTGGTPPPTGNGQDTDALKSPPAFDLPRPDFKTGSKTNDPPTKDVESWVRASTPNPDKTDSSGSKPYAYLGNVSWPPTPKSVWNDYKNKLNRPEINTATVSQAGNVQDFFKSFNVNMYCIGAKNAHTQNRALIQKLRFMAGKQPEYSYF